MLSIVWQWLSVLNTFMGSEQTYYFYVANWLNISNFGKIPELRNIFAGLYKIMALFKHFSRLEIVIFKFQNFPDSVWNPQVAINKFHRGMKGWVNHDSWLYTNIVQVSNIHLHYNTISIESTNAEVLPTALSSTMRLVNLLYFLTSMSSPVTIAILRINSMPDSSPHKCISCAQIPANQHRHNQHTHTHMISDHN